MIDSIEEKGLTAATDLVYNISIDWEIEEIVMITLKLNLSEAAFLESALEDALDTAGDPDYFSAYEELLAEVSSARNIAKSKIEE